MRLGQLARKLERTPTEIIEFLISKGIAIDEGVNSKLEMSQVNLVLDHFAPNLKAGSIKDEDQSPSKPVDSVIVEEDQAENLIQEKVEDIEPVQPEPGDVIR